MSAIPRKLTFAVIIGNRGFFPSYLVADARRDAQALFDQAQVLVELAAQVGETVGLEGFEDETMGFYGCVQGRF